MTFQTRLPLVLDIISRQFAGTGALPFAKRTALAIMYAELSQVAGERHKTWAIDQMTRVLTGDAYDVFVASHGRWDIGEAPKGHLGGDAA